MNDWGEADKVYEGYQIPLDAPADRVRHVMHSAIADPDLFASIWHPGRNWGWQPVVARNPIRVTSGQAESGAG
jgi:hypothetical protein